jgi:hypothetical protein
MGYDVHLTPQTRDGGRDILAYITLPPSNPLLVSVECKQWSKERKIRTGVVRQFLFTLREQDRASNGWIVTTAYFSSEARLLEEQYRWQLSLRDHDALMEWLDQYGKWKLAGNNGIWLPKR